MRSENEYLFGGFACDQLCAHCTVSKSLFLAQVCGISSFGCGAAFHE
jgi:hypothetical protein